MTFDDLKTELLSRAKVLEICPAYHAATIATDRPGILNAIKDIIVWTHQAGILDNILIEEFADIELNAIGIYKGGESLTNPTMDIYYLKSGSPVVTIDADNKCKIAVMGAVSMTLNLSGNAYADVKCFDIGSAAINVIDKASTNVEVIQNSSIGITANDNTVVQLIISDKATASYTGNNNSHGIIKGFNHSQTTYLLNHASTIQAKANNQASVTNLAL